MKWANTITANLLKVSERYCRGYYAKELIRLSGVQKAKDREARTANLLHEAHRKVFAKGEPTVKQGTVVQGKIVEGSIISGYRIPVSDAKEMVVLFYIRGRDVHIRRLTPIYRKPYTGKFAEDELARLRKYAKANGASYLIRVRLK